MNHEVREQLRSQMLDTLVQRRPRLFAGVHYATCRRLVQPSIATFATELQRSIRRGILSGATWTALRAYQRGMRATSTCPYCGNAPENEEHIFWQCLAWSTVRDTHLPGIRTAAAQVPGLPLMDQWSPCLRLCGLALELDPHVPPVPSIEHWKRDQYCPVTGGNFRKSVPTCMRYASVRRLEVFENPWKDARKFWQPDRVPKRNQYR